MINRTEKYNVAINFEIDKATARAVADFYSHALCDNDSNEVQAHIIRELAYWVNNGFKQSRNGESIIYEDGNRYEVKFELEEEE